MHRFFRAPVGLLALVLATLSAGCADTTAPQAGEEAGQTFRRGGGEAAPDLEVLARFRTRPQVRQGWAARWIGPEGGRLDFAGFAVEVPRGAVDHATLFVIRLPADSSGAERVTAQFEPAGVPFARDVFVELPYSNTTLEGLADPAVVRWAQGWTDMGGELTGDGERLRTSTDQLSTYGATEVPRTGAIVVSGG